MHPKAHPAQLRIAPEPGAHKLQAAPQTRRSPQIEHAADCTQTRRTQPSCGLHLKPGAAKRSSPRAARSTHAGHGAPRECHEEICKVEVSGALTADAAQAPTPLGAAARMPLSQWQGASRGLDICVPCPAPMSLGSSLFETRGRRGSWGGGVRVHAPPSSAPHKLRPPPDTMTFRRRPAPPHPTPPGTMTQHPRTMSHSPPQVH